jgi:pimeloyl-ACP methyl ester carboxylesterase
MWRAVLTGWPGPGRGRGRIASGTIGAVKFHSAAGVLAGAVAALGLASTAYQAAGEARDRRRFPPPGRLVDVGGHRLHISSAGEGSPTVVIIPALGAYSAAWLNVQERVAADTAVCVYDRRGLGWSDPSAEWPSAAGMARDLHTLLETAGIRPPFVVVGHSMGGLVARMFTHMYPGEVAAVALVDSSHPEQLQRLTPARLQDHPGGKLAEVALNFAHPLGLSRLRQGRPGDAQAAFALSPRARRAGAKELLTINAVCRQTGRTAGGLGSLPLAVITSSERAPGLLMGSRAQRSRSRFYPGWAQLQDELAALSTDSVHVVAANAGHHLNRDDPELVVNTITDLVRRARKS